MVAGGVFAEFFAENVEPFLAEDGAQVFLGDGGVVLVHEKTPFIGKGQALLYTNLGQIGGFLRKTFPYFPPTPPDEIPPYHKKIAVSVSGSTTAAAKFPASTMLADNSGLVRNFSANI